MVILMSTLTPTLVIAVIAIVSPIITNWMNNRHLEKEKILDFQNSHAEAVFNKKVEAVESFLKASYTLRSRLDNLKHTYTHEDILGTIEDPRNSEQVLDKKGFKADILSFNQALAAVSPLTSVETMIKLMEFSTLVNSYPFIESDLQRKNLEITTLLHSEINNSKPNYDEYRPKEIKDIIFGIFNHVKVTENSDKD